MAESKSQAPSQHWLSSLIIISSEMEEEKSALTLLQCYSSDSENEDGEDGSMSHQQIGSSKELEPPKGGSTSTVRSTGLILLVHLDSTD